MKRLVVLSGAGISAESGIKTFRDSDGLWENYPIEEVATPEAWQKNPALVLEFYNQRRKQAWEVSPNAGHLACVALEKLPSLDVHIITQNVDDLHERAGSSQVLHLHGMLRMVRSSRYPSLRYDWEDRPLPLGDVCEKGAQLRPDIVWFGEMVPEIEPAAELVASADAMIVVGTSLQVYPAAGLVDNLPKQAPIWLVDPKADQMKVASSVKKIALPASTGMQQVLQELEIWLEG